MLRVNDNEVDRSDSSDRGNKIVKKLSKSNQCSI